MIPKVPFNAEALRVLWQWGQILRIRSCGEMLTLLRMSGRELARLDTCEVQSGLFLCSTLGSLDE